MFVKKAVTVNYSVHAFVREPVCPKFDEAYFWQCTYALQCLAAVRGLARRLRGGAQGLHEGCCAQSLAWGCQAEAGAAGRGGRAYPPEPLLHFHLRGRRLTSAVLGEYSSQLKK